MTNSLVSAVQAAIFSSQINFDLDLDLDLLDLDSPSPGSWEFYSPHKLGSSGGLPSSEEATSGLECAVFMAGRLEGPP